MTSFEVEIICIHRLANRDNNPFAHIQKALEKREDWQEEEEKPDPGYQVQCEKDGNMLVFEVPKDEVYKYVPGTRLTITVGV